MVNKKKIFTAFTLAITIGVTSAGYRLNYVYGDETEAVATDETETTGDVDSEILTESEDLGDGNVVAPQVKTADLDATTINGHDLIAENDNYKMFLNDEQLSIIIQDKETGSLMESSVLEDDGASNDYWKNFMKSGVVIEVIDNVSTIFKRVSLNEAEIDLTKRDDGFTADITYPDYGISYTFIVTLTEDGFTAEIPDDSITETEELYKIANIYIYPFLGYTHLGERDGYMLIPDGNGAIINLDDKEGRFSSGYSKKVYGDNIGFEESYVLSLLWNKYLTVNDDEYILAPVFGMVHNDTQMAYLGIIEDGAYDASIEAYPNGAYTNYNWITSKFRLRQVYVQPTSKSGGSTTLVEKDRTHSDIKVRYIFTNGDDADYVGLAGKYRDYLLDNNEITKHDNEFNIRLDFLGSDLKKWFIFNVPVPMTTIEQVKEILLDLKSEGVDNILAIYKGWQDGGINSVPIDDFKVESKLGSKKDLINLVETANSNGIDFYLYQDALRANPDTSNTTYNVVKKIDKRLYEEETYKDVFEKFVYLTPQKSANNVKKLYDQFASKGINNVALTGITNNLFSYTYSGDTYSRVDTANIYEDIVAQASEDMNLILDEGFSYLWKYSNALFNFPTGSSDYIFTDEDVPFLSTVLKGVIPMYSDYTNFEADKTEYFLKLVETGIYPSFLLTYEDTADLLYTNSNDVFSAKYSVYKDEIIEYYNKLKEINDQVMDSYIVNHEEPEDNVAVVTYDNGVVIYVNYNDYSVTVDGVIVEPLSYKVGGSHE